jgi:hypothetical protein
VEKEAYDPHFGHFFMQIGIALCTREKSMLLICSGLIGIKDLMELKYDWNDEVILQFYSTLYIDEKSNKLFWMTEDELYSISLVRFTTILGLQDHTCYPKKLHDDRVMEINRMRFMYEKDEYKLSKVEGFEPFFCSISFCGRLCLQGRVIHLGSLSMKETSYMPSVKKKGSMWSTLFFRKSKMCLSPTTGHVPMHPIS